MAKGEIEILSLHDFSGQDGLSGPELEAARSTPWAKKIYSQALRRSRRVFALDHEIKKAGRFYATTSDGYRLQYRLDGNIAPESPTILFSNSLLTSYGIWDGVVDRLAKELPEYQFLRYNTRGYEYDPQDKGPIDFELLADDDCLLLDHLKIPKVKAMFCVSMGGVTTLNFTIRHPDRLDKFIASDCNSTATPMNNKAWEERVQLGKTQGIEVLAEKTVQRWFTSPSVEAGRPFVKSTQAMITSSSFNGFLALVHALCNYDLRGKIEGIRKPGLLTVGESDGVLPKAMGEYYKNIPGANFAIVPDAGHLPAVENPDAFAGLVLGFLQKN